MKHDMTRRVLSAGLLLVLISACGSPTAPSVANVEGVWRGDAVATSCQSTPFQCENAMPRGAPVRFGSVNLRLTQSERSFHGFLFICGGEDEQITGTIGSNGMVTITSTAGRNPTYGPLKASLELTITGTVMTGSFTCIMGDDLPLTLAGTVSVTLFSRNPNAIF
jgi:hypothetical protein